MNENLDAEKKLYADAKKAVNAAIKRVAGSGCGDPSCGLCYPSTVVSSTPATDPIVLVNLKTNMPISVTKADYDNIEKIAKVLAQVGESSGIMDKNGGFHGVDIPLTNGIAILSVRRTVTPTGKEYQWMLEC